MDLALAVDPPRVEDHVRGEDGDLEAVLVLVRVVAEPEEASAVGQCLCQASVAFSSARGGGGKDDCPQALMAVGLLEEALNEAGELGQPVE